MSCDSATPRSALPAAASVAPVVTTSSTSTRCGSASAVAARSCDRPADVTAKALSTARARCSAESPAKSGREPETRSSRATSARNPCARSEVTACRATRETWQPPRARATRRCVGIGTSHITDAPDAATATVRARAAPSPGPRSCLWRSLSARTAARAGPSYGAAAHTGGRSGGAGSGAACRTGPARKCVQDVHILVPVRPQPPHVRGISRSLRSLSALWPRRHAPRDGRSLTPSTVRSRRA